MKRFTHYILLGTVLTVLFPTLFASCVDDETFTTDRSAVLAFSADTVSFDTVFAGVGSSTERLNVYNRNSNGVRISNVRLESGGTAGFKMNVDGRGGTTIDDVEILKEDSIFVFVEVNADEQSSDKPVYFSDAIIFTLESGVQQKVTLEAYGQNITVLRAEVLKDENTVLSSTIPYVIYDSLVVAENATLHIAAGTTLCFHNGASLIVHGGLSVEGTLDAPVTFRGDRTDRMFSYLPYDRLENQWGGIYLFPTSTGCSMNYADIHSGNYGVVCEKVAGEVNITNSVIHNVAGYGLYLEDCKATIANTQVSNTKFDCVSVYGGTANFYHCTMAQFYPWSADRGNALYVSNYIGDEEHLIESLNFYNCFATGYANDEVYGNPGDRPLNLHFYNCVLLTDVSDETYFHNCTQDKKDLDTYKATNFRTVDTDTYYYDFHLDSLSTARGKGSSAYTTLYPLDHDGVERGSTPDAGCYQFK